MTSFGVSIFPTDYAIQPMELAKEAEARGFESLFFPEHTHIPTSRRTAWPGGGDLPQEYWHTHDPFVSLMAAAAVTETLKVGTGILLVPERDPIVTAKQIASLDMISGGRVLIGIGAGWNAEELEDHGVAFKDCWKVTRESVLAWRALWKRRSTTGISSISRSPGPTPSRARRAGRRSCWGRSRSGHTTGSSITATAGCRSTAAATWGRGSRS